MLPDYYRIITTEDKSPTLVDLRLSKPEAMHHFGGAWSESLQIYNQALQRAWQRSPEIPLHITSVGLGLGYNELMSLACAQSLGAKISGLEVYESEIFLQKSFLQWSKAQPGPLTEIYNWIEAACHRQWPGSHPREALNDLLRSGNVRISGALPESLTTRSGPQSQLIYFDAFSKSSMSELWDEVFLMEFISKTADKSCVFASYASTGSLNRALKKMNFENPQMLGFHGKRNSTLAWR